MDSETLEQISTVIDALKAETALYIATCEMRLEALEQKYSPNQPRVPAGNPDGGQWTSEGGGGGGSSSFERRLPNDLLKPDRDAIDEVYPEAVLPVWRGARAVVAVGRARAAERNAWSSGRHKSPQKWTNQMRDRNWSPEDIARAVSRGKKYPAPNKVNPRNTATRYEHNGRYVVRDDVTKEIIQIGSPDFKRPPIKLSKSIFY